MSWRSLMVGMLALVMGLISGEAVAEKKLRIAVLELQGRLGREELGVLSDQIRAGVVQGTQGQGFVVMSRENMAILLKDMGQDCETAQGECEVETGRNIGAAYVVSGSVVQMGGEWVCTVKVHDVTTGAFLRSAIVRGKVVMDMVERLPAVVAPLMAQALGGGGAQPPPPPGPVAGPVGAEGGFVFNPGGAGLSVNAKLKAQECDEEAKTKGAAQRSARLDQAAQEAMGSARTAWRASVTELEQCTKLKRAERAECITLVEQWLTAARQMTVKLPGEEVSVETDCGERRPAFREQTRTVAAADVGAAQTLLTKLKAADVVAPVAAGGMIVGRVGPRPVATSGATSTQRKEMKERWDGCRGGNSAYCTQLGLYQYESGQGVVKSLTRAAELYRLACDKGEMFGCTNLGILYRDGRGVPQSHKNAVTLYRQACDAGHAAGCSSLGVQYENGQGVTKSQTRANELYRKGCDGKSKNGCTNLGLAYEFGRGVPSNMSTARSYYKKGCDLGHQKACAELK